MIAGLREASWMKDPTTNHYGQIKGVVVVSGVTRSTSLEQTVARCKTSM